MGVFARKPGRARGAAAFGIGRTAATSALVFAVAALSALWVAGPSFEARAVVTGLSAADPPSGDSVEDWASEPFADAVAARLGEAGAFLRTPSVAERIASLLHGAVPVAAEEVGIGHIRERLSITPGTDGDVVVSARSDDAEAATTLAEAAAAELVDRLRDGSPEGEVSRRVVRRLPQPFTTVGLVAAMVGAVLGATVAGLGRRATSAGPDDRSDEAEPDGRGAVPSTGQADDSEAPLEAVSMSEIAAALEIEPVSCVFVVSAPGSHGRARRLARRLAGPDASVLLLDFSSACSARADGGGSDAAEGSGPFIEIVPVESLPSALSQEDRSVLAHAGEAYDHVIVDCGQLAASEIALLADEDSAVLVIGGTYAAGRTREFEEAGLATLVLAG